MANEEKTLLEKYAAWLTTIPLDRLAAYDCPGCGKGLKTLRPSKAEGKDRYYDGLASCPFCEDMHFKKVGVYGEVEVKTQCP